MSEKLNGLLLVLDGLVLGCFNELLARGDMPNVSRHLVERNLIEIRKVISCHPSSTYENMQAINTGCFPFDPGATYFSSHSSSIVDHLRSDNTSKGYCAKRRTIFHHIPDSSISIHNPWNDGADDKHPNIYSIASIHYLRGWEGSNAAAVSRFKKSLGNRKPKFTEIWFPAHDRFSHKESDKKLRKRYIQFDKYIGSIADALRAHGLYDSTLMILTSDHGMENVSESVNPNLLLFNAGFRTKIGRRRNHYDSRVFAYGYSVGQLYLNGNISEEELAERMGDLVADDSVEHVIVKSSDCERMVYSESSTVRITMRNNKYKMEIITGNQPFGYSDALSEKLSHFHTARDSLELTCMEEQPDAVVGIAQSMRHPNSPDLRFLSAPGYDFSRIRNGTHFPAFINARTIRTHGNLHKEQNEVPLFIAGSDDTFKRHIVCARSIDWFPTFLEMAGYDVPNDIDGVSLLTVPP